VLAIAQGIRKSMMRRLDGSWKRRRLGLGEKEQGVAVMMADALNGRQMEVDAIAGNAVRIAERLRSGEKVPILRMVWVCVSAEALNGSIRR
jgi:ketopantoate reductase